MPLPVALRSISWLWPGGSAGTSCATVATTWPRASRNSTLRWNALAGTDFRVVASALRDAAADSGRVTPANASPLRCAAPPQHGLGREGPGSAGAHELAGAAPRA